MSIFKKIMLMVLGLTFFILPIYGFSHVGYGHMGRMGNWFGFSNFNYGGIIMGIIILLIIGVIIYLLVSKNKNISDSLLKGNPLDELKKRYAKGEITKKEFDQIKKDIE